MSEVSLTNLYQEFLQNCSEVNIDSQFSTEQSEKFLGDAIRRSIQNVSQTAIILTTLCLTYKELKDFLDSHQENVYDFLIDYIRCVADRLVTENKLNSLLLTKSQVSSLEEEINYLDSDQALIDAIPVHLSFIANGKFAKKYTETLEAIQKDNLPISVQKVIDKLNSKKQNLSNILEGITSSYIYIENDINNLLTSLSGDQEINLPNDNIIFDINGKVNIQYLYDRVIRVFLLLESYKKLCTDDMSYNSRLLTYLMNFLQVQIV